MSLIEIMIVLSIIAMVSAGVAVYAVSYWNKAKLKQAATDAETLRSAVGLYWATGSSQDCPTLSDLIEEQAIGEGRNETDPWGQPYTIACDGPRVLVASSGPDGQAETSDDIVVPRRRGGELAEEQSRA